MELEVDDPSLVHVRADPRLHDGSEAVDFNSHAVRPDDQLVENAKPLAIRRCLLGVAGLFATDGHRLAESGVPPLERLREPTLAQFPARLNENVAARRTTALVAS